MKEELKTLGQQSADIQGQIDKVMNFSILKNKLLAEKINPYFKHFQRHSRIRAYSVARNIRHHLVYGAVLHCNRRRYGGVLCHRRDGNLVLFRSCDGNNGGDCHSKYRKRSRSFQKRG